MNSITLVAIDTSCHNLTKMAIETCLQKFKFDDVLVFSNQQIHDMVIPVDIKSNYEAEQFMWYGVYPHLKTTHALFIQWDGFIVDSTRWTNDFFNYDYIGAIWPWYDHYKVGNGGFTLRSKKFLEEVYYNKDKYPFKKPEDVALCREYRPMLEKAGMKWASSDIAKQFSSEREISRSFGFHGLFNFPVFLSEQECMTKVNNFTEYQFKMVEYNQMKVNAYNYYKFNLLKALP